MTRTKVRTAALRRRILQQRGLEIGPDKPIEAKPLKRVTHLTPMRLKTASMIVKEMEFNLDIGQMLTAGPLHHNPGVVGHCGRCISCLYGIDPSTASKWRKRLAIPAKTKGPSHA